MRNYSLDVLKFICAILVLIIHVPPPPYCALFIDPLRRCAVPLFFMISGYFTYAKPDMSVVLRRRILFILRVFAWMFLFYSLVYILNHDVSLYIHRVVRYMPNMLCFNNIFFATHLWYLPAYIYVLLVVWLVDRSNAYKWLFGAIPLLIVAGIFLGKYYDVLIGGNMAMCYSRNFLFTGVPFFALGMLVKRNEEAIHRCMGMPVVLGTVMAFYAMSLLEIELFELFLNKGDLYMATPFMSFFIFVCFLKITLPGDNVLSHVGREDGLYIYLLHVFVSKEICYKLFSHTPLMDCYSCFSAPFVLAVTLLLIWVLRRLRVIGKIM